MSSTPSAKRSSGVLTPAALRPRAGAGTTRYSYPATPPLTGPWRGHRSLRPRPDYHDHLAAFHLGHVLDPAHALDIAGNTLEKFSPEILMRHLAASKTQRHLDLVARLEELEHVAHLDVIVVRVGVGAELDFLDLDGLLLLACLGLAFLLFVLVLSEIHDLADRRLRIRRYFHEVEPDLLGHLERPGGRNNADILAIGTDEADFVCADAAVDAGSGIARGWRVVRSAGYGFGPCVVAYGGWIWPWKVNGGTAAFKRQNPAGRGGWHGFPLVMVLQCPHL